MTGKKPMPEDITYTQEQVDGFRRCAMVTGYAYGRQDQRWSERGPLVHADEFELAALERGTGAGGLLTLYEELAAAKSTAGKTVKENRR